MENNVSLFAHEGIHHKTVFEAVMHVLSQWIMIIIVSILVALTLVWFANHQQAKATQKTNDHDSERDL